jgi:YbbR domain-containing protein
MKKEKNSCRSKKWLHYNDFINNPNCTQFLVKLFHNYGIGYQFKNNCVIVRYNNEKYRIVIDAENIMVKLINKRTGTVKAYWKDNPFQEVCADITACI